MTKGALGPVFSAGLFGLMIGALIFGPLADRIGRKKIIVLSTLAFGIGALVTALVGNVTALLVIRFLTGLGLGGAMPNAIAMTSEFRNRSAGGVRPQPDHEKGRRQCSRATDIIWR